MSEFGGKVALVAGGARGIGRQIAGALAGQGASVVLLDAPAGMSTLDYSTAGAGDLQDAVEALRAGGGACVGYEVDVRDRSLVIDSIERVIREVGPVSLLVDCAGVASVVDAGEMTDEEWSEVVDTNLHGFYNLVRAVVGPMTEIGAGNVLVVVGDEARRGMAGLSHVSAAGWGAIGLAKSLALETAAAGVTVNVLCVGPVETDMTGSSRFHSAAADSRDPLAGQEALDAMARRHPNTQAWVPMTDVVRAALFLLGSGTSTTGSVLDVSAGLSALNSS